MDLLQSTTTPVPVERGRRGRVRGEGWEVQLPARRYLDLDRGASGTEGGEEEPAMLGKEWEWDGAGWLAGLWPPRLV